MVHVGVRGKSVFGEGDIDKTEDQCCKWNCQTFRNYFKGCL